MPAKSVWKKESHSFADFYLHHQIKICLAKTQKQAALLGIEVNKCLLYIHCPLSNEVTRIGVFSSVSAAQEWVEICLNFPGER